MLFLKHIVDFVNYMFYTNKNERRGIGWIKLVRFGDLIAFMLAY